MPVKVAEKSSPAPARDADGKFLPNTSGNPSGRPPGTKNKSVALKRALEEKLTERLDKDAMAILNKAISMAKAGDKTMIKLLLENLLVPLKLEDNKASSGLGNIQIIVNPMQQQERVIDAQVLEPEESNND